MCICSSQRLQLVQVQLTPCLQSTAHRAVSVWPMRHLSAQLEETSPNNNVQSQWEAEAKRVPQDGQHSEGGDLTALLGVPAWPCFKSFPCLNSISHKPTALNTKQGGEAKSKAQSLPFIFEISLSVSVSRCGLSNAPDFWKHALKKASGLQKQALTETGTVHLKGFWPFKEAQELGRGIKSFLPAQTSEEQSQAIK